jgi:DNA-binding GntR family transcriptional regulator
MSVTTKNTSDGVKAGVDTGVERASRLLRDGILRGRLRQGLRLSEVRLAKEFGLSRGPVREALRGLEREGLVTSVPNRATFVRRVTPIQVLEALEIRALLEPAAYDAAAKRRGDGLGLRLLRVAAEMEKPLETGDVAALAALHGRFHTILYEEAPNRLLRTAWQQLEFVVELHVLETVTSPEDGRRLVQRHAALAQTLAESSVADGRQAIIDHLSDCAASLEIPYFTAGLGAIFHEGLHAGD